MFRSKTEKFSLSRYFPKGTQYFYGYPAEKNSHFFNSVPPEVEEIVAARPFTCAGPNVNVICYPSAMKPSLWRLMHDELKMTNLERRQIATLPRAITTQIKGDQRNKEVVEALLKIAKRKKLIMAQPYIDNRIKAFYQIPPHRIIWLNDKRNMPSYIPKEFLPERYVEFLDGMCFFESNEKIPVPCVVKVTSSSSGNGVRLCRTKKEVQKAKEEFKDIESIIIVEQFIDVKKNIGVQFGIPCDPKAPIEIIGFHEQITDKKGAFLGGIINPQDYKPYAKKLTKILLKEILPEVRKKGWYGVGGFDVLISQDNKMHFIDSNFRMTGMTVYDFLFRNGIINKPLVCFAGTFQGTEAEFKSQIMPLTKNGTLFVTALTEDNGIFSFNAALTFDNAKSLKQKAKMLLKMGIKSQVLHML